MRPLPPYSIERDISAMQSFQAIRTLDELLTVLCRSLPAYLADAKPWTQSQNQQLREALDHLVADQRRYAHRVAEAITEYGGRPDPGRFPSEYAAKNDLSIDYLRPEIIEGQERDIATIEQCVARLEGIAPLHSLAEEILGNARGHLDILNQTMNDER